MILDVLTPMISCSASSSYTVAAPVPVWQVRLHMFVHIFLTRKYWISDSCTCPAACLDHLVLDVVDVLVPNLICAV